MKQLLKRLVTWLAYTAAGFVILMAVLLGLFRLLLPKLPEYQEDIKNWVSTAIGLTVEFEGMNARWRLSGPELIFYDAELFYPGSQGSLIEAGEVTVGVGLIRLLTDRTLVADRVLVRDTALDIAMDTTGELTVQGLRLEELRKLIPKTAASAADIVVQARDIAVVYRHTDREILGFAIDVLDVSGDDEGVSVEASLDLPDGLGNRLDLAADQRLSADGDESTWQLYAEGRALGIPGWLGLMPSEVAQAADGSADASVWIEFHGGEVSKATANVSIEDLAAAARPGSLPFDVDGRFEYSRTAGGWLLAADNFRMRTADAAWPESSVQLQVLENASGAPETLLLTATYLNADDLGYVETWFPERLRALYSTYLPSGEIRNLRVDLAGLDTPAYRFDVAAELTEAGMAVQETLPGVQGFSGSIRANRFGGRLEIDSSNVRIDIPRYVPETLIFDDAMGTVIWRRSDDGIIVLSDGVRLRNADLDSRSSLQITLPADGAAPQVDLDSRWSIHDVSSAKRLLPERIMHPALYRWFDEALVAGMVTNGTTRLVGPLDAFPFDNGEGRFEVNGRLENATIRYAPNWPELSVRSADVTLEGLHLYTRRNVVFSVGNAVNDGNLDIRDLREPVLELEVFATGTLQSVRDFGRRSPIAAVFGGRLDQVQVEGDASFTLELSYPIKDRSKYEFQTRIQTSGGIISMQGFPAPVTDLNGVVAVSRQSIRSESLFGSFMGQPVSIDVKDAGEDMPSYSVVVDATGRATADALVSELNLPLGERLSGATDYRAAIRFPRRGEDRRAVLQIAVESDLDGLGFELPAPLHKEAQDAEQLSVLIEFPEEARITSNGSLGERLRWILDFAATGDGWDFDRGMLAFGGDYPALPEKRGLHVQGQTSEVRVADWLAMGRRGDGGDTSVAERVREIDLSIDDLYVLGQHLTDQHVLIDRGAGEWFITADGPLVTGSVTLPYDLSGQRAVVLDMERLVLPGSDEPTGAGDIDPRDLPPIELSAGEFGLGARFLGEVRASFARGADGLRATGITAADPSFSIEADAGWVSDPETPSGQRSYLRGLLVSNDVGETMRRLDYNPGIESDDMRIEIDVEWPGGPRGDFLADLDGTFGVRLGDGQLNEVEPGAGRMFGLMSIAALPRRLSLDFRDVLEKGFGFDEITGTFRVEDGNAYTCDLSLKGPAADIGIVGRAGLADRDYSQTAIVSANVGDTLPVVGAVVAGPQVAAALLIFSQIFKKPLQEMGQVYYRIEGSFDEPDVEVADAQRFAESGAVAGCLADAQ